jgi:hypothetical protein
MSTVSSFDFDFHFDLDFDPGPMPASPVIAQLIAEPGAAHWAQSCAWVPGTGHCRNRPCAVECLFRAQRDAEATRVKQARRRRRRAQQPSAGRAARLVESPVFAGNPNSGQGSPGSLPSSGGSSVSTR